MSHAVTYCNTKLELKGNACGQRVANYIFSMLTIFRYDALVPNLPTGFDMWRDFIEIEHALIPTDHLGLQFPLPDANTARFVGEGDALHQPLIHPLGVLQVIYVFDLCNKVERGVVAVAYQRNGQQCPDDFARARVIALFHGVAIDFTTGQHAELFEVVIQIFRPGELLEGQRSQFILTVAKKLTQRLVCL